MAHTDPQIRAKALCVFRRGDRILVSHALDAVTSQRYARPLGGTIEFGERAVDALRREILEELGAQISSPCLLGVLENLFTLEGRPGHEIVFVFDAEFADPALYEKETLPVAETGGSGTATWISVAEERARGIPLYPDGLLELIEREASSRE